MEGIKDEELLSCHCDGIVTGKKANVVRCRDKRRNKTIAVIVLRSTNLQQFCQSIHNDISGTLEKVPRTERNPDVCKFTGRSFDRKRRQ
jgi:hypothetical protein